MSNNEKKIQSILWGSVPLLAFAMLIPVIAFFGFGKPIDEDSNSWFQRSGSIVVIFAVWVEFNLSKINGMIIPSGLWSMEEQALSEKYTFRYSATKYLGVVLAVVGTIIWGYGDILYEHA